MAGLLLAAGGSERLGEPKQLLKLRGESLVLRATRLLLTQTPNVTVVIGAHAAKVGQQLKGLPVCIARNEDWRLGMGGSIASGMSLISDEPDGVLIMLCDQWRISQQDLKNLVVDWKENPSEPVVARWKESHGSPAILPRCMFNGLQQLRGDRGAKSLIAKQLTVHFVDVLNAQFDLDTDKDLQVMQSRSSRRDSGSY